MFSYSRWTTREVAIGNLPMGGLNPIRIQSMTTTDTMNTLATVEQTIKMVNAGCEYVRITAPSIKEAQNLTNIKKLLSTKGYHVPLIADIHFTPNAAEIAARIVEKVRINPGNYIDKKKFASVAYTNDEYNQELEKIFKKFTPLVRICKEYGTAMRIGVNHGSLSDRIMSRYGDTPHGMVESALEFISMCENLGYHNLVISMKSSNPQIMIHAYRLLVATMIEKGMNYPLHLGVTEAGDGEDGRIKSAVGIGTLLADGLGDTIRVSLTEDPEYEIPVAKKLISRYLKKEDNLPNKSTSNLPFDSFNYQKRTSVPVSLFGGGQVPRVIVDFSKKQLKNPAILSEIGYHYSALLDKYTIHDIATDFVYFGNNLPHFNLPGSLKQLYNYETWLSIRNHPNTHPLFSLKEFLKAKERCSELNLIHLTTDEYWALKDKSCLLEKNTVIVLESTKNAKMSDMRTIYGDLLTQNYTLPIVIRYDYSTNDDEQFLLDSSTDVGALIIDGFGDGVWLNSKNVSNQQICNLTFGILQATRTRISKTEYISCPSCGRTLFDLQETTQMIRAQTNHLKGIKIGIMGCIVNGPGEMADADYGYVGSGVGKITLYRGKEVVKKNINTENALDELINIIREDNNWIDPPLI